MPHLVIEYSANIAPKLDVPRLVGETHGAAVASGLFEQEAIRTRARKYDDYLIGDGNRARGFVHMTVRIRKGRTTEQRKNLADRLLDVLLALPAIGDRDPQIIKSVEIQEFEPEAMVRSKI